MAKGLRWTQYTSRAEAFAEEALRQMLGTQKTLLWLFRDCEQEEMEDTPEEQSSGATKRYVNISGTLRDGQRVEISVFIERLAQEWPFLVKYIEVRVKNSVEHAAEHGQISRLKVFFEPEKDFSDLFA